MTLPFDQNDKDKRKWQCFVCGQEFTIFDDFKSHIIDQHEEGREFIKCPACDCPVRDLKLHFKIKHPNRIMPKNAQDRAIIWHDFTTKGKKKTKKPQFQSGDFPSKKNGRNIHYRSGMEQKVYQCLEEINEVLSYKEEPFKVPYYFVDEKGVGEWKSYTPDLRVNFADGHTEIWEIKPSNQTSLDKNEAKWVAMNDYAKQYAWDFKVVTEIGLNKLKKQVRLQENH